jgi:glycosyltransferase involved in cell wall biosynthesis
VHDGENGLLVPLGDSAALGDAIRRYFGDEQLGRRLRAGAAPSVAKYSPDRVFAQLEQALQRVARTLPR